MANMGILQEVDKCIRCNGCVISCKRTHGMVALNAGIHKMAPDQRVVIKSSKAGDMGPFVRFSCWHCPAPACAGRCPKGAITKEANGAVNVDFNKCEPSACNKQCVYDCLRGGYPRVGVGSTKYPTAKSYKCTMCFGRAGVGGDLPTRATAAQYGTDPDREHEPACVYTCPAKAMHYLPMTTIMARLNDPAEGWIARVGNGNVYWASKKSSFAAPKADPFVEDHISPMVEDLLSGPVAKTVLVPAVIAGGLYALSVRRAKVEQEALGTSGEVG